MATQLESSLQVSDLILQASPVVQLVMLSLLLASLYSWYLIAKLTMSYKKAQAGSVAPYVGLFGTVWGIMNAFIGLADVDQVTLATVAPGIAEALIATAIGLFAAIPAVLAFNHFTSKGEALYSDRALFAEEMAALLQRQSVGATQDND